MRKIRCSLFVLFISISVSCSHDEIPVIDPELLIGVWELKELDYYSSSFKTIDSVLYLMEYTRTYTDLNLKVRFEGSKKYTVFGNFTMIFSATENGRNISYSHGQYLDNPGRYEVKGNKFFTYPVDPTSYLDPIYLMYQMEVTILELTPKRLVLYSYSPPRPETENTYGSGQSEGLQVYTRE